jgi:hypothetical protein
VGGRSRRPPGEEEEEVDSSQDTGFSNAKTLLVIAIVVRIDTNCVRYKTKLSLFSEVN